jgi:hypothetical protein
VGFVGIIAIFIISRIFSADQSFLYIFCPAAASIARPRPLLQWLGALIGVMTARRCGGIGL